MADIFEIALDIQSKGLEHAKKVLRDIDTSGKGVAKNFDAITAPVNKLKAAFGALGVVISAAAVGTLFKRAIQEAGDAEAAMASLEQAVENTGGNFSVLGQAAESAAKNIQRLTRFSDDAAIGALATMTTIAGSGEKAIRNLGLAADIAAAKHIDLDSAATLVGRVLAGNTSMLKRYGIVVKEGSDAMQQLREKFTGFAEKDGATFQGRLEQMRNAFLNVLEAIGRLVTGSTDTADALGKIRDKMDQLSDAIDRNAEKWRDWAKGAFDATKAWFDGFQERSQNVAHWFNVIAESANTAGAALRAFLQQGNPAAWKTLIENQRRLNAALNNQFADVSGGGSTQGAQQLSTVTITGQRILDRAGTTGAGKHVKTELEKALERIDTLALKTAYDLKQIEPSARLLTPDSLANDTYRGPSDPHVGPDGLTPLERQARDLEQSEAPFIASMNAYAERVLQAMTEMGVKIREGIAATLGDAIYNGFAAAFSGDGLGGIFKAFGKTILAGIGSILTDIGKVWLEYGLLMTTLGAALWNPFTSGPAAIAIGAALVALGAVVGGVAHGGGGRGTATAGAFRERGIATEDITRLKFVDRFGNPAANLVPRPANVFNVFGPDDPKAQRAIVQAIANYERR